MTGARFVHDPLERLGWQVEIADAQKVKGLAPLACKTDRIDAWVLAELARRDLVPAIWLPDPRVRAERERARWRLHLVPPPLPALKQRVHAVAAHAWQAVPGLRSVRCRAAASCSHGWGYRSRGTATSRGQPAPDRRARRARSTRASASCARSAPTTATCRCSDRARASAGCSATRSPPRSATSTASPPHASSPATPASARRVYQSGATRPPRPARQAGPATCAGRSSKPPPTPARTPSTATATSTTSSRLGKQRGAKVAQIDLARRLSEAIWHMLTRNQPFAPAGATTPWPPDGPIELRHRSELHRPGPPAEEAIER